jgi:hypothetical protein
MKILARLITIFVLVCISQVSAAVEQTQSEPEMKMDESKNDGAFKDEAGANAEDT